ncbi:MAG: lysostaphin resistance A-like protein [Arachnia sp.]
MRTYRSDQPRLTSIEPAGENTSPQLAPRVPWLAVIMFTVLACALAWAVILPAYLGQASPDELLMRVLSSVMMYTPALATLAVVFLMKVPREPRTTLLGLWPLRPAKRVIAMSVIALLGGPVFMAVGLFIAAASGLVSVDLANHSLLEQTQLASIPDGVEVTLPPVEVQFWLVIAALPVNGLFVSFLAFGEEIGWRGWLLPTLQPLGTWPALLISGAIWGIWHAPLTLLGHNFGVTDWRGVAMMVAFCITMGMLLGWLRLRTGSLWPAVFAHGSINAGASVLVIFGDAAAPPNPLIVGSGIISWALALLIVALLAVTGQFRRQ